MHNSLKKLVYCMISITAISVVQFKAVCLEPLAVLMLEYIYFDLSVFGSLRSRRLQVVGTRKNGRARRRHSLTPCVSPSRAPVLSFARYFQAPATQATFSEEREKSVHWKTLSVALTQGIVMGWTQILWTGSRRILAVDYCTCMKEESRREIWK